MKTIICLILLALQSLILGCATPVHVAQPNLVFLGTVEKLEASPMPRSTSEPYRWPYDQTYDFLMIMIIFCELTYPKETRIVYVYGMEVSDAKEINNNC
jgi:hypothetical protein